MLSCVAGKSKKKNKLRMHGWVRVNQEAGHNYNMSYYRIVLLQLVVRRIDIIDAVCR